MSIFAKNAAHSCIIEISACSTSFRLENLQLLQFFWRAPHMAAFFYIGTSEVRLGVESRRGSRVTDICVFVSFVIDVQIYPVVNAGNK